MEALYIIFGFCLCCILIGVGGWVASEFFKYKTKLQMVEKKVDASEKVKFHEEMASMKHRLVVLEKIVTQKGYQVNEEIETLKSVK